MRQRHRTAAPPAAGVSAPPHLRTSRRRCVSATAPPHLLPQVCQRHRTASVGLFLSMLSLSIMIGPPVGGLLTSRLAALYVYLASLAASFLYCCLVVPEAAPLRASGLSWWAPCVSSHAPMCLCFVRQQEDGRRKRRRGRGDGQATCI